MAAAWRSAADTASYRVRKREAGNLVTSMTLAVALSLPWLDIAWRFAFGLLLNLFVYLLNDCFDVRLDLDAPGRDHERTKFLAAHTRAGWAAVGALTVVIAVVVIAAYSAWLKRLPVVDVLAMGAWGITMALVGFPLASRPG